MAKKILLADDSLTIQKVVQITFARQDAELTMVDNGDDALARLQQGGVDIVLADVMMPGKDGYQLAQAIKGNPATAKIPVLLLAGAYEPFDEGKAKASGANGHILKPFESQNLIQKVDELLAGGGAVAAAPAAPAAAPKPAAPAPKPAAPAPKPAAPAPAPKPAAPAPKPAAAPPISGGIPADSPMWDLSDEPAAPPPPAPPPPAAAAARVAATEVETFGEVEVEVDGGDAWDLSEEPAAPVQAAPPPPPPPPPPVRAAPLAPPPPPPPTFQGDVEVDVDTGDAWDLSEEPAAPAAPAPVAAATQMLEIEEPRLEPAPEVEVAMDTGGDDGDVWDLAEDQPTDLGAAPSGLELDTGAPSFETEVEVETEVADDAWDLSEEVAEPAPTPIAQPEPVRAPPPPPPPPPPPVAAPPPVPAPVAAAAPTLDASAIEAAVRQAIEAKLGELLTNVAGVVAEEVRKQVPRIAEELITKEIAKLKA